MKFLLKEIAKSFKRSDNRKRVGFIVPKNGKYSRVTASTRIRVYDVIQAFEGDANFQLELFRPSRSYDIVVFLKTYDKTAHRLAEKLQAQGTNVVFDININIFESGSKYATNLQREEGIRFVTISNSVITNSPYTESVLKSLFPHKKIDFLGEAIHADYFKVSPKKPSSIEFIWMGYKHKAAALYLIKEALLELFEQYPFSIKVICEENPNLDLGEIPITFQPYRHKFVAEELSKATAFIAPRDLSDPYNMGHSFTKIGTAMAVGLPVVASPLPAYLESPAVICNTKEEWKIALESMLSETIDMNELMATGKKYCHQNFGIEKVKQAYSEFFSQVVSKSEVR